MNDDETRQSKIDSQGGSDSSEHAELRCQLFDIIAARTTHLVDYRMLGDHIKGCDNATDDIIEMLKERGLLA